MRSFWALVLAGWRTASSYRLRLALSVGSLLVTVVPVYFVAGALQDVMDESIRDQGGEYFAFLIVGMVAFLLLPAAVNTMPTQTSMGVNTGVLEALLGTPAGMASVLLGLAGFNLLWTTVRAGVLLLGGWFLGAALMWSQVGPALVVLVLIVLAYLPIGMLAAASVIAFRTPGPLPPATLALSALLGGVYYPTEVIPSWIQTVSDFVPLTYGLRALRRTLLEGLPLTAVAEDVLMLTAFVAILSALGWLALHAAVRYARRAGTLTQY